MKVNNLNAGGLCPPTHLLPPEWIPSQAFLFLDTRRVVAWSAGGPRLSLQDTVIPLAPPVRCIWRRKLKRSCKISSTENQERLFSTLTVSVLECSSKELLQISMILSFPAVIMGRLTTDSFFEPFDIFQLSQTRILDSCWEINIYLLHRFLFSASLQPVLLSEKHFFQYKNLIKEFFRKYFLIIRIKKQS